MSGLKAFEFGKKSVLRNPLIASLFHRLGYIEKMGTGISRMQDLMKGADCPPIEFEFTGFVTAVFRFLLEKSVSEKMSEKIFACVQKDPQATISDMAHKLETTTRTIERNLAVLKKKKRIERVGSDKGGYWRVLN